MAIERIGTSIGEDEPTELRDAVSASPPSDGRIRELMGNYKGRLYILGLFGAAVLGAIFAPQTQTSDVDHAQLNQAVQENNFNGMAEGTRQQLEQDLNATLIAGREGMGLGDIKVPVWLGMVEKKTASGWKPFVKDPIDLDIAWDFNAQNDLSHNLPYRSNLGVVGGSIEGGGIEINTQAYTDNLRFVPTTGTRGPTLTMVSVYAIMPKAPRGGPAPVLELIGYQQGEDTVVLDPAGAIVTPGHPVG